MDSNKQRVIIYLMNKNDRTTEQNVVLAVKDYCKMQGISISSDDELEILRSQTGKPYFSRLGGIYFSVSHSGDYFACAVSKL